jgi:DNA-binding CsgD family transcriptional regulator
VHLAEASRLFDALRFDEARDVLEKTHTDAWPEHWTSVAAHRVLFDAYAGRSDTWALLSRLDSVAMEHASTASGMTFNQYMLDYVRCTVLTFGGQFERAIAIIDAADDFTGRRQSLAQRSVLRYLLGDVDAAARDADGVLAAMRRWPRGVVKALIVRAAVEWRRGRSSEAADYYRQAVAIGLENELLISFAAIPHEDSLAIAALAFPEGPPEGLQRVLDVPHLFVPPVDVVERLTPQEQRVLTELAAGRTVVQAAARLGISENTGKVHARAIYRKLNVGSRAEMLAEASRRGLV